MFYSNYNKISFALIWFVEKKEGLYSSQLTWVLIFSFKYKTVSYISTLSFLRKLVTRILYMQCMWFLKHLLHWIHQLQSEGMDCPQVEDIGILQTLYSLYFTESICCLTFNTSHLFLLLAHLFIQCCWLVTHTIYTFILQLHLFQYEYHHVSFVVYKTGPVKYNQTSYNK